MKKYPNVLFAAGGFIRSCITNEHVSDIDLFTPSKEQARDLAQELASASTSGKIHETDNALTVKGFRTPIQFIHRWTFTKPEDALESFDFTIAMAAFWCDKTSGWQSCCGDRFYQDLAAKRLIYRSPIRNEDAGGSMLRVLKFYQRGYRIPLDSLGAVIARLNSGIEWDDLPLHRTSGNRERAVAMVVTGLLREVDPLIDATHAAHLPSEDDGFDMQEELEIPV
jgi:hypothetical protein